VLENLPIGKLASAVLCVVVAITGMVLNIPLITISALVLWVVSMAYFGLGDRSRSSLTDDEIKRMREELNEGDNYEENENGK